MSNVEFVRYKTAVDRWRQTYRKFKGMSDFDIARKLNEELRKSRSIVGERIMDPTALDVNNDGLLMMLNRPYFKVWPSILKELIKCKMEFSYEYVGAPFVAFEVCLPSSISTESCDVRSFIVSFFEYNGVDSEEWKNRITVQWHDGGKGVNCNYFRSSIKLNSKDTVEESILSSNLVRNEGIMRIAVSICMFGTNQHELVAPDIQRKHIEKWRRAKEEGDTERQKRYESKTGGFVIGREIDLPEPSVIYKGDDEGSGQKLKHGHLRRAHMRMQAVGEGRQERKLVFVRQCWVRPDLPQQSASRGYRIKGNA